jgi:hypothetical protein
MYMTQVDEDMPLKIIKAFRWKSAEIQSFLTEIPREV